jgi:hypothetical protein
MSQGGQLFTPCASYVTSGCLKDATILRDRLQNYRALQDLACNTCIREYDTKDGIQIGSKNFERLVKVCYLGDIW